jgi:hypothetical protein
MKCQKVNLWFREAFEQQRRESEKWDIKTRGGQLSLQVIKYFDFSRANICT